MRWMKSLLWMGLLAMGAGCPHPDEVEEDPCLRESAKCEEPPRISEAQQSAASTQGGGTVRFRVVASDPQGRALSFAWTSNVGTLGSPENAAGVSEVVWTAPSCLTLDAQPEVGVTVSNEAGRSATTRFVVGGLEKCLGWVASRTMAAEHTQHAATLLPSGQVLVTGSSAGSGANRAERFDAASGTWTPAGTLSEARGAHTATLLSSGRVLVAGGARGMARTATAELYDAATDAWTATGAMGTARSGHTATLLGSGKVLVTGGFNGTSSLAAAELYDAATGTWTATGGMVQARTGHTATLLPSGWVLVAGGLGSDSDYLSSVELYDPSTGTWTSAGRMSTTRAGHTATLLPSGRMLVTGGVSGSAIRGFTYLASAELYDPSKNVWMSTAGMSTTRSNHTATLLPSGQVLVAGGIGTQGLAGLAELYTVETGTWERAGDMVSARAQHTATLLPSGSVLVAAGSGNGVLLSSAEVYRP